MPQMDQTGPYANGPVGRGMGPCGSGFAAHRGGGFGMGRGFRRGGGCGWFSGPASPEDEKELLELQEKHLKANLEMVQKLLGRFNQPEK